MADRVGDIAQSLLQVDHIKDLAIENGIHELPISLANFYHLVCNPQLATLLPPFVICRRRWNLLRFLSHSRRVFPRSPASGTELLSKSERLLILSTPCTSLH